MAEYFLSPEAMEDLQSIWDFIASDSPAAADRLIEEFFQAFDHLAQWPGQGHFRRDLTDRSVRFWPVGSYLVVYREDRVPLEIVAVLHGARDVPRVVKER